MGRKMLQTALKKKWHTYSIQCLEIKLPLTKKGTQSAKNATKEKSNVCSVFYFSLLTSS